MKVLLASCLSGLFLFLCCLLFFHFWSSSSSVSDKNSSTILVQIQNGTRGPPKNKTCGTILRQDLEKEKPHRVPGQKAEEMCMFYADEVNELQKSPIPLPGADAIKLSDCEILSKRLIKGGSEAEEKEFPHMVLIGSYDPKKGNGSIMFFCGGSLISKSYILTAAHCNVSRGMYALVGSHKVDHDFAEKVLEISEVHVHPGYDNSKDDIALLKLSREVLPPSYARPACLDVGATIRHPSLVMATGWGYDEKGTSRDPLQKVELQIFDEQICSEKYNTFFDLQIIPDCFICAGTQGKDACEGDSGGPLQVLHPTECMYILIGVTSFGMNCTSDDNIPGVYTKVSKYTQWIEDIVWP